MHRVRLPHTDTGASAVEYGLLVFAIAAVIALIVFAFGLVVGDTYQGACDGLVAETGSPQDCDG
jgi:pilus assembly protein Flp/PilA